MSRKQRRESGKGGAGVGLRPTPSRSPVTPLPGAEGQPSRRRAGERPAPWHKPSLLSQEVFFLRCRAAGRLNRGLWVCSRLEYARYSVRKSIEKKKIQATELLTCRSNRSQEDFLLKKNSSLHLFLYSHLNWTSL